MVKASMFSSAAFWAKKYFPFTAMEFGEAAMPSAKGEPSILVSVPVDDAW
jgi:hypothetical protein